MKIGILTSSRADFGIYLPLLQKLKNDDGFDLTIIAFGTHCSDFHGKTVAEIQRAGFTKIDTISTVLASDDEASIVTSYGLTVLKFADYWQNNKYDLVFCLGDRYEMSAAVQSGIPFRITFAHLHGGETTLGAIDNIYRHQITLASAIHFTSTTEYAEKVKGLIGSEQNIYDVGALTLDGLEEMEVVEEKEFKQHYQIPDEDFVLTTFHPETVAAEKNAQYAKSMAETMKTLTKEFVFVITMPNADTMGSIYRQALNNLKEEYPNRIILVENFGKKNYFSAMKYAKFLLGNTSSGIVEAASFGKYVVNVGDRQKGRAQSENILNCKFEVNDICEAVHVANRKGNFEGNNVYRKEDAANSIIKGIKNYHETL